MQDLITFITNHLMLSIAALLVLILLFIVETMRAKRLSGVSPQQTVQLINHDNAVIIDIRPKEAFQKGHIIDAYSMTNTEINENPKKLERFKNRPLIIVCATGVESHKMAAQLMKSGYNAHAITGGIRAWIDAQLPLVKE